MDELKLTGILQNGYGIIGKKVTQDRNLTLQAKAIYSYFCSFAGKGTQPFPSVDKIIYDLNTTKGTYYKHLKLLKEFGYITVEERKDTKGRFMSNIYTINIEVEESENYIKKEEQIESVRILPSIKKRDTDKPNTENCNPNNNIYNNNINNNYNNQVNQINHSKTDMKKMTGNATTKKDTKKVSNPPQINSQSETNSQENYNTTMKILQENISYNELVNDFDSGIVQEIVYIIMDTILSVNDTVKIGKEFKAKSVVAAVFLKLEYKHIEEVINNYINYTDRITNKPNFIRTMLYNTKLTFELDTRNFVSSMYNMEQGA